jgi:hypothetical protein
VCVGFAFGFVFPRAHALKSSGASPDAERASPVETDLAQITAAQIPLDGGAVSLDRSEDPMKSLKLIALPLAVSLAIAAAQAMPAAANGGTATAHAQMQLGTGLFPTGGPVPDGFSGTVPVAAGKSDTITAPQYLYQPPASPSDSPSYYKFVFWDVGATPAATSPVGGTLFVKPKVTFTAPSAGTVFDATAWYVPTGGPGGCGDPLPGDKCGTEASVSAFSLTYDTPLTASPIASVTPASAETSAGAVSTTGVSPTIAAQDCLHGFFVGTRCSTNNVFNTWFRIGASTASSGLNVTVKAGHSPWLIAMYDSPPVFHKPPCIPGPPPNCL